MMNEKTLKSAQVQLIGAPNAGKSTLLNSILGTRLSVTNRKAQTTRTQIRGIHTDPDSGVQLVFADTPGLFDAQKSFEKLLVQRAMAGMSDADFIIYILDARVHDKDQLAHILSLLKAANKPTYLVLNKVDLLDKNRLLPLADSLATQYPFKHIFMVSSLRGTGVADLVKTLQDNAPEGPWYYPEDDVTDLPEREFAADVTREKIFHLMHEEIPYSLKVVTDQWTTKKDGSVRIDQTIVTDRESHKGMLIGKQGQTLKQIGMLARKELEKTLGYRCHLFLRVRVDPTWKQRETTKGI